MESFWKRLLLADRRTGFTATAELLDGMP